MAIRIVHLQNILKEFLEWTKSVWTFPPAQAKKIGHPAPFPVELPLRLIKLYTFKGEVVLDPFMGSGTTAIAALMTERHFVGYEIKIQNTSSLPIDELKSSRRNLKPRKSRRH